MENSWQVYFILEKAFPAGITVDFIQNGKTLDKSICYLGGSNVLSREQGTDNQPFVHGRNHFAGFYNTPEEMITAGEVDPTAQYTVVLHLNGIELNLRYDSTYYDVVRDTVNDTVSITPLVQSMSGMARYVHLY